MRKRIPDDLLAQIPSTDELQHLPPALKMQMLDILQHFFTDDSGWPLAYTNRDTGRVYAPHSEAEHRFVYQDGPWRYGLLKGGEGCVAAETLIEGVPIAERSHSSTVTSVAGVVPASRGYQKGRADLYKIQVESGAEVVVTLAHRFLTRTGWRQLGSLSVGDEVAAYEMQHEPPMTQTGEDFLGGCHVDFHSYDESPSPVELVVQDKLRLLHILVCDGNAWDPFSFSRPCKIHCAPHEGQTRQRSEWLRQYLLAFCESVLGLCCSLVRSDHMFHLQDNASLFHPSAGEASWLTLVESLCRTFRSVFDTQKLDILEDALPLPLSCRRSSIASGLLQDRTSVVEHHAQCKCRCASESQRCEIENNQSAARLASDSVIRGMRQLSVGRSLCPHQEHYTTNWSRVQGIKFVKEGDFYDLRVPFWDHYLAQGFIHHNSGKSTAGIIKDLNRIKSSMSGMIASPNLPHFQRSLWKEFQRWCPWDLVIPAHRRMGDLSWIPVKPFDIVFENGAYIHCVGARDTGSLEGPNLTWAHFDEARHFDDAGAVKVIDGRIRIDGPNGEPPQVWFTTTPRMNWLYDFFGPMACRCDRCGDVRIAVQEGQHLTCPHCLGPVEVTDRLASFKMDTLVVTLLTQENVDNLTKDFVARRAQSLTVAEIAVLLNAEWMDIEHGQPFLPNILWWDACKEDLPTLSRNEPLVLSLDAATGRQLTASDCFAILGVTRHPSRTRADTDVAVRFTQTWQAGPGQKIDFAEPEEVIRHLCTEFNVIAIVYDPTELHAFAMRLGREGVAWFKAFTQVSKRHEADRALLNLITHRRMAHDGNPELRRHMQNADRRLDSSGKRLRIVKRVESQRIDLAVCLSMGSHEILRLNL